MKLAEKILELQVLTDNLCNQAKGKMNGVKMKILFLLWQYKIATPRLLISKTGIVKSNLALACKKLINEGCIISEKSLKNQRHIKYSLTDKGEMQIKEVVENLSKIFRADEQTTEVNYGFSVATSKKKKKV